MSLVVVLAMVGCLSVLQSLFYTTHPRRMKSSHVKNGSLNMNILEIIDDFLCNGNK